MSRYRGSMAVKRDRTQQRLDQLRAARSTPGSEESIRILRDALKDPSNYVVAKAAEIIEQGLVAETVPALLEAFDRFFAAQNDRGCEALTSIAKALYALDYQVPDPYLKGIRHHQPEGYGTQTDVATGLRSVCGLALVQTSCDRTLEELVLLLTDEYAIVRQSAARALGCTGLADAVIPLLLFKVHTGDAELEVIAECMVSMLALAPRRTLPFIVEQLDSSDSDRAEAAAIALGTLRSEEAFDALRQKWDATAFGTIRERILHAMAASRTDPAIAFLTRLVAEEPFKTAVQALRALAMHRRDSRIRGLVEEAVARRGRELEAAFSSTFGSSGTL